MKILEYFFIQEVTRINLSLILHFRRISLLIFFLFFRRSRGPLPRRSGLHRRPESLRLHRTGQAERSLGSEVWINTRDFILSIQPLSLCYVKDNCSMHKTLQHSTVASIQRRLYNFQALNHCFLESPVNQLGLLKSTFPTLASSGSLNLRICSFSGTKSESFAWSMLGNLRKFKANSPNRANNSQISSHNCE